MLFFTLIRGKAFAHNLRFFNLFGKNTLFLFMNKILINPLYIYIGYLGGGLQTRPLIRQTNCSLSHKISIRFQNLRFIFHVSFFFVNNWISITFEKWNIVCLCFIFSFMFHLKKHSGSVWSLPLCFWIAPTEVLNRSHSVFVFLPQCF